MKDQDKIGSFMIEYQAFHMLDDIKSHGNYTSGLLR